MVIKFKKLTSTAKLPTYAHPGDAGMDIYSDEEVVLKPGETKIIKTGLTSEFENGYVVLFWGKGGITKNGIDVLAGVIDAGYRGEWKVVLHNLSNIDYVIKRGDKITQALIHKVENADIIESDNIINNTSRGKGGFGSTGLK